VYGSPAHAAAPAEHDHVDRGRLVEIERQPSDAKLGEEMRHRQLDQGIADMPLRPQIADAAAEERAARVREALLRAAKGEGRVRLRALEEANAEAVRAQKLLADKSLSKLRADFGAQLEALRGKYEARAAALARDLALRARVEVHEAEERRNLHIHQLARAHEDLEARLASVLG
jgi:hypothetical protein